MFAMKDKKGKKYPSQKKGAILKRKTEGPFIKSVESEIRGTE